MTDRELFDEVSKRFGLNVKKQTDQNGKYGIQLVVSGINGKDEYSFTSLHRDTEDECISDFIDWMCVKTNHQDSPEKHCDKICMASSRPELELKLGLMQS